MGFKEQFNIILELAKKDIRLNYNNTVFVYLWMVINPLFLLITLYIVFSIIMKMELPNYQIFLLLGIIVWNFFSEATTKSLDSIRSSVDLLKKIKIPLYSIIFSANVSSIISFAINLTILVLMMLIFRINIFTPIRILSLVYFALLFLLVVSVSFLISTAHILFKDTFHIWNFLLLIGFWLTPIIYPEQYIPTQYLKYYMLNPLARLISHLRNSIIYNHVDSLIQILITVSIVFSVFFVSVWFYNNYAKKIYDVI